ncbi:MULTISPECIES: hypothetical protein [Arenibacter]|uniref:hypothetical protein n=1 Tax=Arenibacter TaxID=178469 RepID=UPI0008584A68|nr:MULTISPECIES: hypothetical protein [Arenibacter]GBF19173.1 hypothetical protein C21_01338 [Arenibacter sp. NBRC 103722]
MIKKIVKILLGVLLLLFTLGAILYAIYNEPLPSGIKSQNADALAQKMLTGLNYEAYLETRFLEWSFANGKHHYRWDKEADTALVMWSDYVVSLDLKVAAKGRVAKDKIPLEGLEKEKLIKKATSFFNNDSFWLVAPFKVFDPGTERSIVSLKDGTQALLVTYTSGGDTPGDSYLWKLQPNGFPISFKMWVSIIPIGGIEASWDEWQVTESGAFLPSKHSIGPITLDMGDVRGYR